MKRTALAIALVTIAGAMFVALLEEPAPAPEPVVQAAAPTPVQPLAVALPSSPPAPHRSRSARIPREEEWKSSDAATVVGPRSRMEKDKRAFVDRAVAVGGAGHLYVARQVIDQCSPMREAGMAGAEKQFTNGYLRSDPQNERRLDAFRALIEGCEGFEQRPVTKAEYTAIQEGINVQYEALARAARLPRLEAEEARLAARQLIETGDPLVIGWVGSYVTQRRGAAMGPMRTDEARYKDFQAEKRAWMYAVCELGIECPAGGYREQYACAYEGQCDYPWADAQLRKTRDEIVAAVRNRDWARLGL